MYNCMFINCLIMIYKTWWNKISYTFGTWKIIQFWLGKWPSPVCKIWPHCCTLQLHRAITQWEGALLLLGEIFACQKKTGNLYSAGLVPKLKRWFLILHPILYPSFRYICLRTFEHLKLAIRVVLSQGCIISIRMTESGYTPAIIAQCTDN